MTERRWWLESFTVLGGTIPLVAVVEEFCACDERDERPFRKPYAGSHPFIRYAVGVNEAAAWLPLWEEPKRDQRSQARRSRSRRKPSTTVTPRGNPTRPTRSDAD